MKSDTPSFLIDRLVVVGYIVYSLRTIVHYINSPETHYGAFETLAVGAILLLMPILLSVPFFFSTRIGAYLFICEHSFRIVAGFSREDGFNHTQYVSILLVAYTVVRLLGLYGPTLRTREHSRKGNG